MSAEEWVNNIEAHRALTETTAKSVLDKVRGGVGKVYFGNSCQLMIAMLIFGNFVSSAVESQLVPEHGTAQDRIFYWIETCLTAIFTLELVVHLFVVRLAYFRYGWNILDLLVVAASLVAAFSDALPGLSTLRIVRALRVVRLFGRLQSLRKIINALSSSWVPVVNAFVIIMFMTAIYAILGVAFFRQRSARLFENFATSFFTMFTVITMESWVELLRVDMSHDQDVVEPGAAVFFISFILICAWTILPVVIAIMLSNFMEASRKEEAQHEEDNLTRTHTEIVHCLDPIMQILVLYTSPEDLRTQITQLFQVLDVYDEGSLSFDSLRTSLLHLHMSHNAMVMRWEDFLSFTNNGKLCAVGGGLGPSEFERAMVRELKDYVERRLASAMAVELQKSNFSMAALLAGVKLQHSLAEVHHKQEVAMFQRVASISTPHTLPPIASNDDIFNDTFSAPNSRSSTPTASHPSSSRGRLQSSASLTEGEGQSSGPRLLRQVRDGAGPRQQALQAGSRVSWPAPGSPVAWAGSTGHTALPHRSARSICGARTRRLTAVPHRKARTEDSKRKEKEEEPSGEGGKPMPGDCNENEEALSDLRRSVLLLQEAVVSLTLKLSSHMRAEVHQAHPSSNEAEPPSKSSRRLDIYLQPFSSKRPPPEMLAGGGNTGAGGGGVCGLCKMKAGTELCLDCGRILCWPCRGKHNTARATHSHTVISRHEGEGMECSVVPLDGGRVRVTTRTAKQEGGPNTLPGGSNVSPAASKISQGNLRRGTGSEGAALGRRDGAGNKEGGKQARTGEKDRGEA